MPRKKAIENVVVKAHDSKKQRYSIGCDYNGARYHIWMDVEGTLGNTLYKNPPLGTEPHGPGWYYTRHLNPRNKINAALIVAMLNVAGNENLYIKAAAAREEELAETERKMADLRRDIRMRNAGPELFTFLSRVLPALPEHERAEATALLTRITEEK